MKDDFGLAQVKQEGHTYYNVEGKWVDVDPNTNSDLLVDVINSLLKDNNRLYKELNTSWWDKLKETLV